MKFLFIISSFIVLFISCTKEPNADFNASKMTAKIDEIIIFTNVSTDASKYKWNFGDNIEVFTDNTEHKYNQFGTYNVELTAYSENKKKEDIKIISIIIQGPVYDYFTDNRDGYTYKTIKIGNQWWLAENIQYKPTYGNYWYQNNDVNNIPIYGYLYDYETSKTVVPEGWHIPNLNEWKQMLDYLGHQSTVGANLKEIGTEHWRETNSNVNNSSGFTALPGGQYFDGTFYYVEASGRWIIAKSDESDSLSIVSMHASTPSVDIYNNVSDEAGFSIRCIKD